MEISHWHMALVTKTSYCKISKSLQLALYRVIKCSYRFKHYDDVIMGAMASEITGFTIVYSTVYSRRRSKKTSKLRVTGLCEKNSPVTGEFPSQRASNAEKFPFDDVIMHLQNFKAIRLFLIQISWTRLDTWRWDVYWIIGYGNALLNYWFSLWSNYAITGSTTQRNSNAETFPHLCFAAEAHYDRKDPCGVSSPYCRHRVSFYHILHFWWQASIAKSREKIGRVKPGPHYITLQSRHMCVSSLKSPVTRFLFNSLFRSTQKKASKFCITGPSWFRIVKTLM